MPEFLALLICAFVLAVIVCGTWPLFRALVNWFMDRIR